MLFGDMTIFEFDLSLERKPLHQQLEEAGHTGPNRKPMGITADNLLLDLCEQLLLRIEALERGSTKP